MNEIGLTVVALGGIPGILSAPVYLSGREGIAWVMLISAFGIVIGGVALMVGGVS